MKKDFRKKSLMHKETTGHQTQICSIGKQAEEPIPLKRLLLYAEGCVSDELSRGSR